VIGLLNSKTIHFDTLLIFLFSVLFLLSGEGKSRRILVLKEKVDVGEDFVENHMIFVLNILYDEGSYVYVFFTLKTPKITYMDLEKFFVSVDLGFWGGLLAFW